MLDAFLTVCFSKSPQIKINFPGFPVYWQVLALQFLHSQKTVVEERGAECLTMDGITKPIVATPPHLCSSAVTLSEKLYPDNTGIAFYCINSKI